jgi:hypothetical protein
MFSIRALSAALLTGAVTLPISYAVIEDGHSARLRESLQRALRRTERHSFEGTGRVEISGPEGRSMKVRFQLGQGPRSLNVVEMEKEGRKIPVPRFYRPPHPTRWLSRLARDLDLALRNYRLLDAGEESVAGRACLKVRLEGRYGTRPAHTLWIDRDQHVILKREVRSTVDSRRMEIAFDQVNVRPREKTGRDREPRHFPRAHPGTAGGPLSGFTVEVVDLPNERTMGFSPVDAPRLPHGFVRRKFRGVQVRLTWPVPRTVTATIASYTDGIEGLTLLQMNTVDLKTVESLIRAHKDREIWQAITQGGFPRDLIRRGSIARVEVGKTTLLSAGSIGQGENRILVSSFLID